jgi:hypothetical protein
VDGRVEGSSRRSPIEVLNDSEAIGEREFRQVERVG